MRINKFVAEATGMSRREADEAISAGNIRINGKAAILGQQITDSDTVLLKGKQLNRLSYQYLLLNKPIGYVSSRKQQDDKPTIYSLIPEEYKHLKPAGRLDADSRGLMLLTNDGDFAHELTHPSTQKTKKYEVKLDRELSEKDRINLESGVELEDGISKLETERRDDRWLITMHEGRNRQIRRTFTALGYEVTDLNRVSFGPYTIANMGEKVYSTTDKK